MHPWTQKMKGVGCSNLGNAENKFLHDVVLGRDMFLFALTLSCSCIWKYIIKYIGQLPVLDLESDCHGLRCISSSIVLDHNMLWVLFGAQFQTSICLTLHQSNFKSLFVKKVLKLVVHLVFLGQIFSFRGLTGL